ncbi:MAG: FHA domain-containing protein [Oscillochloris sp.]|nr:FHA domain-containing protein [Oscillochloris sp.]
MAQEMTLVGVTGSYLGKPLTVAQRICLIGSSATCDIVLHDRQILPRHAEVRQALGGWFVAPLEAGALVAVNGQRVSRQGRLNEGDLLTIGSATFRASFLKSRAVNV